MMVQSQIETLTEPGLSPERLRRLTWTTAAKQGLGTAYYDGSDGASQSNVWYTLAQGMLTEVYYPDIATANVRELQFAVSDGMNFFAIEGDDCEHSVELIDAAALIYRQESRARNGRFAITKTYLTNPRQHALAIEVTFRVFDGCIGDYQWFMLHHPAIGGALRDNEGSVWQSEGRHVGVIRRADTALAVSSSIAWQVGHLREEELPGDLSELRKLMKSLQSTGVGDDESTVSQTHLQLGCFSVDDPQVAAATEVTFVLTLGFANQIPAAIHQAQVTQRQPFSELCKAYSADWHAFVQRLSHPSEPAMVRQYNIATMVLKAHEDKRHLGAVAASLSIPWGHCVSAAEPGTGGYHLIWSRDLYQIASGLALAGDASMAWRALRYLQDVQQLEDGSFPQNTWPDGTPYWLGVQLDQTAFSILLAHLIDAGDEHYELVKKAADFLVRSGPHSQQERWEENSGYSPSTLAAVIASLVAAGSIARKRGDLGATAVYLATADKLASEVESWTVARCGPLSDEPYYLRVSDTLNPDDGHFIQIKNGGGWHPKAAIVDGGFLDLVRLGIKAADDPVIVASVDVIDREIFYEGTGLPLWYRYNYDGYGEAADGAPYNGTGRGHPWPLLSGERGEYEIALKHSAKRSLPAKVFGAERLLQAMAETANEGGMIAEQVWDGPVCTTRHLYPGKGTGAATPLAWAMAQYVRLAQAIMRNENGDTPADVVARYVIAPPGEGPRVRLDLPENLVTLAVSEPQLTLTGQTMAGCTVAFVSQGRYFSTQADASGRFSCTVTLYLAGDNTLQVIGYDNDHCVSRRNITIAYRPRKVYSVRNANPATQGNARFMYPTHPDFKQGDFSLTSLELYADKSFVYFEIELGHLDNPWGGPTGISKQIIDIYLANPKTTRASQEWTKDLGAHFREGAYWHKLIRVSGNWHGEAYVYNSDWSYAGPIALVPHYHLKTVDIAVPISVLEGCPDSGWGIMVVVASEAGGTARPVRGQATEWTFGGGRDDRVSYILDFLVSAELAAEPLPDPVELNAGLPMNYLP